MKPISLKGMGDELKEAVLFELGFFTDGQWIYERETKARVFDKYSKAPVPYSRMLILPGSTVIIEDNPLSLIAYCEEYGVDLDELVGPAASA